VCACAPVRGGAGDDGEATELPAEPPDASAACTRHQTRFGPTHTARIARRSPNGVTNMSHVEVARQFSWWCELCEKMHPIGEHTKPDLSWPPAPAQPLRPVGRDSDDIYRCDCGFHLFADASKTTKPPPGTAPTPRHSGRNTAAHRPRDPHLRQSPWPGGMAVRPLSEAMPALRARRWPAMRRVPNPDMSGDQRAEWRKALAARAKAARKWRGRRTGTRHRDRRRHGAPKSGRGHLDASAPSAPGLAASADCQDPAARQDGASHPSARPRRRPRC
jgi:hypothetical protein